jgi:hypothetical protein
MSASQESMPRFESSHCAESIPPMAVESTRVILASQREA